MTREDIKTITDIVHKTLYGFFDVCGDDEETPMTDKDKLLLKINKAICNNIKALEQEPCGDAISRKDTLAEFKRVYFDNDTVIRCAELILGGMPPVTPQLCDDVISRRYLLDNCVVDKVTMPYVPVSMIENAPPVTP